MIVRPWQPLRMTNKIAMIGFQVKPVSQLLYGVYMGVQLQYHAGISAFRQQHIKISLALSCQTTAHDLFHDKGSGGVWLMPENPTGYSGRARTCKNVDCFEIKLSGSIELIGEITTDRRRTSGFFSGLIGTIKNNKLVGPACPLQ